MTTEFKEMIDDLKSRKLTFFTLPSTNRLNDAKEAEVKEFCEALGKNESIKGFSFHDSVYSGEPKKQIMITLLRALKTKKQFTELFIPFEVDLDLAKEISDLMDAHPELEELMFQSRTLLDARCIDLILQSISRHPHLQKLSMHEARIGGVSSIQQSILQRLGQILKTNSPPLKELDLHHTDLVGNDIKVFVDAWCEGLTTPGKAKSTLGLLNLGENHIWNMAGESLARMIIHNSALHTLKLYAANIEHQGFLNLLTAIKDNQSIKNLNLSRNVIHLATGDAIAAIIEQNKTIVELNLELCDMTTQFIPIPSGETIDSQDYLTKMFKALEKNKTLTSLSLRCCRGFKLGDKATTALVSALKVNSTVKILNLGQNPIEAQFAQRIRAALKENKGMKELTLTEKPATEPEVPVLLTAPAPVLLSAQAPGQRQGAASTVIGVVEQASGGTQRSAPPGKNPL